MGAGYNLEAMYNKFVTQGYPVVIGEYGANGVYQMGLFDRNAQTITQPAIINAIMSVFSPTATP